MTLSGWQIGEHYQRQAQALHPVIDGYRQLVDHTMQASAHVDEQRRVARQELAAVYLTELSDAAFARVATLTGFKGFERRDPRQAIAHERKSLERAIAQIDADDRFARRDELVGPAGSLTQELENARGTLEPLEQECQKFETQLGFEELVQIGYDTPAFTEKWWQASYWKHWATGDRICKSLDMNDFGDDVLPAYKKVAEPRNFMREELRRIGGQIDAVHELVKQRDQAQARIGNLEPEFLAQARDYLGEHLEHADAALLEQWAQAEPDILRAVQIGVRKIAGLTAKRQFLDEIANNVQRTLMPQLGERLNKANAKATKFGRAKYMHATFPNNMVNPDMQQKLDALEQQRQKLRGRVDRLVAAENYAGFDLRNDQELWWMYLTQAPPPRFAPTLFDYYQRRPNAQPLTDPDFVDLGPTPGEALATAYTAGEMETGGYLS